MKSNRDGRMLLVLLLTLVEVSLIVSGHDPNKPAYDPNESAYDPNEPAYDPSSLLRADDCAYGSCYSSSKCRSMGGTDSGQCARGFGVCCITTMACGNQHWKNNNSYFQNPSYPSPQYDNSDCSVSLHLAESNSCQVRLDFETFSLPPPNNDGVCYQSKFNVELEGRQATYKLPELCGEFSNQHLYVDVEGGTHVILKVTGRGPQTWKIRVQYIDCASLVRAPDGCQQYYYDTSGVGQVKILGYNRNRPPHLANLQYTACVRKELGRRRITWQVCDSQSFSMTNGPTRRQSAAQGSTCRNDYIQIFGRSVNIGRYSDNVFCGTALNYDANVYYNAPITTETKPFQINVVTNNREVADGDNGNTGFCLNYRQS